MLGTSLKRIICIFFLPTESSYIHACNDDHTMRVQSQLHFLVSVSSLVCIVLIITHGSNLSSKVERSASSVNEKINEFDIFFQLLTKNLETFNEQSDTIFADIKKITEQMNDLAIRLEMQIVRVENSTRQTSLLCQNETFKQTFLQYNTICI